MPRAEMEAEGRRLASSHGQRARAAALILANPESNAVFRAAQVVAELNVAVWLRSANDRGVAASRSQLVTQLLRGWPAAANGARAHARAVALRTRPALCRHWAHRFRVRWAVTWRRLPARSDLDAETVRSRARGRKSLKSHPPGQTLKPILGPKNGAIFWPHFWVPYS